MTAKLQQHHDNTIAAQLYAAGQMPVWDIIRRAFGLDRSRLTAAQRERALKRLEQAYGRAGICSCGQPGQRRGDGGPVTCPSCFAEMRRMKATKSGVTTTKAQPWAAWGGIGYVSMGGAR